MIALILALLIAPAAFAANKKEPACREGKSFIQEIYNCGQNKIAAAYAERCSKASLGAVKAAGAALALQMEAAKKALGASQTASMNDAKERLSLTIASLGAQIAALQKSAAMIADYPQVMIDYPGAEDDETSAGCFSPAFNQIQDIVSNLDQEIIRAKGAREQALAFLQTLGVNASDMSDLGQVRLPAEKGAAPATPKGPKGKNWNASDISGTKPKEKK